MGRSKRSKQREPGQPVGVNAHLHADTKATAAALDDLLSANGLAAADAKAYIDLELQSNARGCAKQGRVLPAARLEELQEGLAKLQAEGVAEGLKAAKVQQAQADSQRKTDMKAALAALDGVLSANGLAAADVKAYLDPQVVLKA